MMKKTSPIKKDACWFNEMPSSITSSCDFEWSFPSSTSSELSKRLENLALSVFFQSFEAKLTEARDGALESDEEDPNTIATFELDLGPIGAIADAVVEAGSGRVSPRIVDESRPLSSPVSFLSPTTSSPRYNANLVSPREYSKEVQKNLRASLPEGRKPFQPLELSHTSVYPAHKLTVPAAVQEKRFFDDGCFFIKRNTNRDNVSYNDDEDLQFNLSL
jgi:hypothetical protein